MRSSVLGQKLKSVFMRKYLQNHLAHIFCPIEINEINRAENVNFVRQLVLQVFSYKKRTLTLSFFTRIWLFGEIELG